MAETLKKYLSLVKFTHTIFAMPFALTGFFLGYSLSAKWDWLDFGLVIACMVFARNAAMGFNRYIDRDIDAKNARTQVREIPAGIISARNALAFVVVNCILFIVATWFINFPCFVLSPVALAVVLGYSLTKRFTALCHLVLGLGLALAPVGAFLALTGYFHWAPILVGTAVLTWVAGFDIIYALQDADFDREHNLNSIPVLLGKPNALWLSRFLHLLTASALIAFALLTTRGIAGWAGTGLFILLLIYQHTLVRHNDLSRINLAFFTTNGIASVLYASCIIPDLFITPMQTYF